MTEDQAKQKACYRGPSGPGAVIYSGSRPDIIFCCIASECMAWQWRTSPEQHERFRKGNIPSGGPDGFCGLGGKP